MLSFLSYFLFYGMIYLFGWCMGYESGKKENQNDDITGTNGCA